MDAIEKLILLAKEVPKDIIQKFIFGTQGYVIGDILTSICLILIALPFY